MKRFLALAALVLGLAACQTEPEGLDVIVGGEVDTVVSVSLPEATRADSAEGFDLATLGQEYKLRYILEIYHGDDCQRHTTFATNANSVSFPVRLAPGRDYTFVAWADLADKDETDSNEVDRYYNTQNGLGNITIVDNTWNAMDESRDAFTAKETRTGFSAQAVDLHLKRPFAKLRVVATDREDVVNLGLTPHTTVVKYSQAMPTAFDASTGQPIANSAIENKSHTVTYTTDVYEYKDNEYTLFADYFFVPSTGTAKFEFNVYADAAQTNLIKGTNFNTDIFVEANKLTTIKGDVLTTGGNVSINVENELGVKETYTYITSAAALLKAMNSDGNFVLGHDITVSEADIAAADRLAATRTTSKKTVIDLNGKTITIDNRSTNNQPLVTLDEGNTLVFAGVGNIVMTEESTGSFIDNNNTNGGVVIEQATVTNDSTKPGAAVVDGNAIVNAAANVEADAISGNVQPQLEYVLANGGEVTLFDNATSNKTLEIATTNPVVIDLNGKTFTFTYKRGFRINDNANVVIKNGTIVNNVDGGRCIETRAGGINFTLENVTLTATNGASQPFTVGGSGNNIAVNINNSTLTSGNGGYGITTFNPVALNINNSTVSGYAALNIKEASSSLGSAGSVINVVGSILNGVNNVTANASNSFSTIMIEDNNIEINVDSTSIVKATTSNGNGQCIVGFGNELVTSIISGCELTFAGVIDLDGEQTSFVGCSSYQGGIGGNIVKFAAEYADELEAEGWIVGEPTDGLVTIPSAIAKVGDNLYKTLAEAVAAVEDGGTIILVENEVFTKNNRYNNGGWWDGLGYSGDKSFTIDLNNHSISQDGSLNDYLIWIKNNGTKANTITLKNGTLDAGKTAYCALATASSNVQKITINLENIELKGNNSNGAVAKIRGGAELNVKAGAVINGLNNYVGIECVNSTTNIYEGAKIYQKGTSSSWGCLVGVSGNGVVNVHGGNGTSARGGFIAMTSGGTINVAGGEWIANTDGTYANDNKSVLIAQSNKQYNAGAGNSVINVTGGTFKGGYNCYGDAVGDAQINIKGGNFNADPSSYLAEGKVAAQGADGRWTLVDGVMDEAGLKAAFEKGGNIVLGADITLSETVTLAEGKTAVLNLNGKKLAHTDEANKYALNNLGTLTITGNGTINARGIYNGYGNGGENVATAKLTIENGTFNAKGTNGGAAVFNYGIVDVKGGAFTSIGSYSLSNQSGALMTIADGVTANNGLYANGATVTINGGDISGNRSGCHVIYAYDSTVTINGGTLYNNNSSNSTVMAAGSTEITYNGGTYGIKDGRVPGNGNTWTSCLLDSQNSAKVIINNGTYNGGFRVQAGTSMTINGGSFNDCYGSNYNIYGTVTVKGGTYTDDVAKAFAKKYIADGYETNANGEVVAK